MDMTTSEKVAYLKGLLDATNFEDKDTEKIFGAFLKVFKSLVEDVEANAENIDNIDSRLSEVDEDLGAVEAMVYGDYEDEELNFLQDDYDDEDVYDFSEPAEEMYDLEESEDEYDFDDEDFDDADYDDELELEDEELEEESETVEPEPEAEIEEESEEEELYEIECPACHETIYLQESVILGGGVDCPACGEPLEFDIEFEEE